MSNRFIFLSLTMLGLNAALIAEDPEEILFDEFKRNFGGSKAAWGDIDGDGKMDLLVGGHVYRQIEPLKFSATPTVGAGIFGDFDNDGDLDVFAYGSRRLFENVDGRSFRDVTKERIPELPMKVTRGAVWGDFNNDAFLDLYIGGYETPYQSDVILLSDKGKNFKRVWTQTGDIDPARGITACDFDRDGDLDIYVSNYRLEQNQLWRNDGTGTFTNSGVTHGVQGTDDGWTYSYGHTIGSSWADMNDDGYFDLFVGNFSHPPAWQDRPRFYRNRGPKEDFKFEDMSATAKLPWRESFASPALGDYDNDGDMDLIFTTVYSGDHGVLMRNDGNFKFTDVTSTVGKNLNLSLTYMASWGDIDNDGDMDIVAGQRLFINKGNKNNWLRVKLTGDGKKVNRSAIGAQAKVELPDGRKLVRQVESGTGEGNANDFTLHFGLGTHDKTVPLEIFWPDGTVNKMKVKPNETLKLTYGKVAPKK